jgi:NAD(P)-dependent dehydrogenase (short-subunit alcohol dehydrogenase family)
MRRKDELTMKLPLTGGCGAQGVLTARKPEVGEEAIKKLAAQGLSARYHSLDVTGSESIAALRDFLERTYGRLDVLINNAGIITDEEASGLEVKLSTVRATLETNTLAPLDLAQALAPLLKRGRAGRIVNMSSGMGALSQMEGINRGAAPGRRGQPARKNSHSRRQPAGHFQRNAACYLCVRIGGQRV